MLERVIVEVDQSDHYLDIGILSLFFTLLAVLLVNSLIPFHVGDTNLAGVMTVLIASLAVAYPFSHHIMRREQDDIAERLSERRLLHRHLDDLKLYTVYFLGTTVAFAISTFFVPESFYSIQIAVLESIGAPTGQVVGDPLFHVILENNVWVMLVTFVLTFFITAGIVFILAWNASVLGVLIGDLSHSMLEVPFMTLPYLPHGLLEIGGYILAGIAGAILSYGVELGVVEGQSFAVEETVIKDVVTLMVLAGICIVAGAAVEVL